MVNPIKKIFANIFFLFLLLSYVIYFLRYEKKIPLDFYTCSSETEHLEEYFIKQVFYNFLFSISSIFCKMFKICFVF